MIIILIKNFFKNLQNLYKKFKNFFSIITKLFLGLYITLHLKMNDEVNKAKITEILQKLSVENLRAKKEAKIERKIKYEKLF